MSDPPEIYRSSPRPDTFFDSPSTSENEDTTSPAFPSSPPIPLPSQRHRSPTRKQGFYLGSVVPKTAGQGNVDVKQAPAHDRTPEFLSITSTARAKDAPKPITRDYDQYSGPSDADSPEEVSTTGHARSVSIKRTGSGRLVHNSSPRSSDVFDERTKEGKADAMLEDRILDAHTMTLKALRGETIGASPTKTSRDDKRAEQKEQHQQQQRIRSASAPASRKVQVVPPPIDTSWEPKPIPDDIVRTPYPFHHRKELSHSSTTPPSPARVPPREAILTLSIRRHGTLLAPKMSKLTIPADPQMGDIKSTSASGKERHFTSIDFDDELFFQQLRCEYAKLSGTWRLFSARSLRRIVVGHSSSCTRCIQHRARAIGSLVKECRASDPWCTVGTQDSGPPHAPRSPRFLVSQGLTDTFSEAKLLQTFQQPKLSGKGRYAWVQWAHRLAATEGMLVTPITAESSRPLQTTRMPRTGTKDDEKAGGKSPQSTQHRKLQGIEEHPPPPNESVYTFQCAAGLEFVEGWNSIRIMLALASVLLLAVAATLLWVFVGLGAPLSKGVGDAGGRVGAGVALGIFVLLIGWTAVLGWLAVSWLVV